MEYIIIILLLIIIALQIYFNLNKKQTQQLNKTIQNNIQTISHTQKEIGQLQNQNLNANCPSNEYIFKSIRNAYSNTRTYK